MYSQVGEIPATVAEVAAQRQLGHPIMVQAAPTGRANVFRLLLVIGVGSLVLAIVLCWAAMALNSRIFFVLFLIPLAGAIVAPIYFVRVLLERAHRYYLYAGGLVYQKRSQPRAISWREIAGFVRRRAGMEFGDVKSDSVIGYQVVLMSGEILFLKVGNVAEDQARFCAQLEQAAAQVGLPISG